MSSKMFVSAFVAGLVIVGSVCLGSDLVPGSDPRVKPIKEALATLVKQIDAGDLEKAKAVYAGEKADLELLKAYVDGVAGAKAMREAVRSRYGEQAAGNFAGLDQSVVRMAVKDFNSVIFLDDPDRASSSADSPLGVGIEFKKVNGQWEVLTLVSKPEKVEQHLARLRKYAEAVGAITEKAKAGTYHDANEAEKAAGEANEGLWPKPGAE